ncbi:MAG: hypothetical protein ACKOTE_07745 [Opitutaceae bacterium]
MFNCLPRFSRPIGAFFAAAFISVAGAADSGALLDALIRKGILKEATGKQRNRVFIAPHIVKIIEAPHA